MFLVYDLIFLFFAIIYLPFLIFRRKFHQGFFSRLGILPKRLKLNQPIWIHAVSVGETMAIRGLVEVLRKKYPFKKFAISTVTPTGNKIARSIASQEDFVFYLPLDLSIAVKKVLKRIDPGLFIIVETELWPNLISYVHQAGIPIIVLNGRLSDRSFRGYRIIRFLVGPILNKVNLFCVQTELDSLRLMGLGVVKDKIKITGNMKFDIADYPDLKKDYTDYKLKLGLEVQDKLLVAGSTHPGEEEMILGAYKKLLKDFSSLRLLIAPRHPERTKDIEKIILRYGFNPIRISQLNEQTNTLPAGRQERTNEQTVFILDTIGQLLSFYPIADIVFVGGSLVKRGGHNILEPAIFEKPILFGPYMFNFRDIAGIFLKSQAAILVHDTEQLNKNIANLLNHPIKQRQLGQRAKDILLNNRGSVNRNVKWIDYYVKFSI